MSADKYPGISRQMEAIVYIYIYIFFKNFSVNNKNYITITEYIHYKNLQL